MVNAIVIYYPHSEICDVWVELKCVELNCNIKNSMNVTEAQYIY